MDTTTQFLRTFYSQKFASFEEFQSKLKDFERLTGSVYIIKSSKKLPETTADRDRLVYSSLQYVCYHFGVYQNALHTHRNNRTLRNNCASRLSLAAMNGKLWITRYHMVHSHPPLPESAKIDSRVRSLQVQEPGKEDIVISEDVQVVLDDIVDQLPAHSTSEESPKSPSPNKSPKSSDPPKITHVERKAAARDRLAARTKKARGLKLAPCLRRLAELASSGSVKDFHKHLGELEALVSIWRRGGVSSLASESPEATVSEVGGVSLSSVSENSPGEVSDPAINTTALPNDSVVIAKAVQQLLEKQKMLEKSPVATPLRPRGRPPKVTKISGPVLPLTRTSIKILPSPSIPEGVHPSQPTRTAAAPLAAVNMGSIPQIVTSTPCTLITQANGSQVPVSNTTVPLLTDSSTGQVQLVNGASLIAQKAAEGPSTHNNQTIVGYVLQPIHSVGAQGSFVSPTILPSNFIPIAPKGPIPEVIQPFQPILPPPPKSVRPSMPVCKPKTLKPKTRQDKSKSPLKDNQNVSDHLAPSLQPFESNESPRPWTSMIMEGDSCPYFLYIEDANFYYSAVEDAWLPVDQQTMAVES